MEMQFNVPRDIMKMSDAAFRIFLSNEIKDREHRLEGSRVTVLNYSVEAVKANDVLIKVRFDAQEIE